MSDDPNICSICHKPKELTGSASITQWISLCSCQSKDSKKQAKVEERSPICDICGKRVGKENKGSFTQFIFRTEYCRCQIPKTSIERKLDFFTSPDLVEEEEVEVDADLKISADSYPADRYKPLRLLGEGSVGVVYLCKDELLSKNVTLKILKSIQVEKLVEFQKEAKATSRLNHPSIVEILDFGVSNLETPYMVLEYFSGVTLEEYLQEKGALDLHEATAITIEVANALQYSHTIGIFHRDIKPSNVLIRIEDGFPRVKLIDFGLANAQSNVIEEEKESGHFLYGTPAYMSPEAIDGGTYDARSEVYSLACMLYELLSGRNVYQAENTIEALDMHKHSEVPILDIGLENSDEVNEVIAKALSKDRFDRYSSMDDFRDAIEKFYEIDAVESLDGSPAQSKPSSPVKKSALPLVLLTVASLTVVIFVFAGWKQIEQPKAKKVKVATKKNIPYKRFEDCFTVEETSKYLKAYPKSKLTDKDLRLLKNLKTPASLKRKPINLNLTGHNLDGSGFKYLVNLPIIDFSVDSESLVAKNLEPLSNFETLESVSVRHVHRADDIFRAVANAPRIKKMDFTGSYLKDETFEVLRGNKTLRELFVAETNITDDAMPYICRLKRLNGLSIALNSGITRKGLRHLKKLRNLMFLDVVYIDDFDDRMIRSMVRFKRLRNIHLGGQRNLNPKSFLVFKRMKKFRKIGIYDIRPIAKYIPTLTQLTNLTSIILTDTDIRDEDLPALLNLKDLTELKIEASPLVTQQALAELKSKLKPQVRFQTGLETISPNLEEINSLLDVQDKKHKNFEPLFSR